MVLVVSASQSAAIARVRLGAESGSMRTWSSLSMT